MDFSERIKREARKYGVEPQSLIMADLMTVGYTKAEAYDIAYRANTPFDPQHIASLRSGILSNTRFKAMLRDRMEKLESGRTLPGDLDDVQLISPERTAKEILRTAMLLDVSDPRRIDALKDYNAVVLKSGKETDNEDDRIRYYLPLRCCDCKLMKEYGERRG